MSFFIGPGMLAKTVCLCNTLVFELLRLLEGLSSQAQCQRLALDRSCSASASKYVFQCFHDRLHVTFAGFVQEIVIFEVLLSLRCAQVATVQQLAADAGAVL